MKICEKCRHQNESEDSYCANCGIPIRPIIKYESQESPRRKKSNISEFYYLIYWLIVLVVSGIVMAILYLIFGFWIELISFIITMVILFGFLSQVIVAIIEWNQENKELKKKKQRAMANSKKI